jgi:hypothetical protein
MPALSMPDQDDGKKIDSKFDVEQAMCAQHQICPQCQELKDPMGDDGKQQMCPCKGMDERQKFGPEPMKEDEGSCHKSIKSMMDGNRWTGNEFCHKAVKSMMDGKCQGFLGQMDDDGKQQMTQCQNKEWGQNEQNGDDGKQQMAQCQNKEWGQNEQMGDDGKQQMAQCQNKEWGQKGGPKSMMGGKEMDNKSNKSLCHKPIKSMMGDEKKGDDKGEKEEIAIFMLIRQ